MSVVSLGYGDGTSIAALGYGPATSVIIVPTGPYPDPWAATSVILGTGGASNVVSQSTNTAWFGAWFGPWTGAWFGGVGADPSAYPDPWAATSEPQDTIPDWIENPPSIPWLSPTPEPDPASFPADTVILVRETDLSGWIVRIVAADSPQAGLDWSTVTGWVAALAPSPDPMKATSEIKSS